MNLPGKALGQRESAEILNMVPFRIATACLQPDSKAEETQVNPKSAIRFKSTTPEPLLPNYLLRDFLSCLINRETTTREVCRSSAIC